MSASKPGEHAIETMQVEVRRYPPDPEFSKQANGQPDIYKKGFEEFWTEESKRVSFFEPWKDLYEWKPPYAKWFIGGKLNVCYNCVDRHVENGLGDKVAYFWEGEPEDDRRQISFKDLQHDVVRFANGLKTLGIEKGTHVGIYMGMVPELPVAMLACARIGAPFTVVFGGFSGEALSGRLNDMECTYLITQDEGWRRGNRVPLKANADAAVETSPTVKTCIVVKRTGGDVSMKEGRDLWAHEMLQGIDALVFDVQDAGVRFYTYTATMGYCMEEAAKRKIAFYVLDRPNPVGGNIVEGPMLDADKTSFTAYFPLPVRYGLTIGELAQLFNVENHINCDLHVIAMKNWHRNYFFESTGARWIPPSPNLRTLKGAVLYPGIEILQNAGVSVGRGTETPFEQFGAPWISGEEVAAALNERHVAGLRFDNHPFIPVAGLYSGQRCGGVAVRITDRQAVRAMRMGMEIATVLKKFYPEKFDPEKLLLLVGNAETIRELQAGTPPEKIVESWNGDLTTFELLRKKFFLYK